MANRSLGLDHAEGTAKSSISPPSTHLAQPRTMAKSSLRPVGAQIDASTTSIDLVGHVDPGGPAIASPKSGASSKPQPRREPREPQPSTRAHPAANRDIELIRERTRGRIAYALIALLAVVVLAGAVGLVLGRMSVDDVKALLSSLGTLTTLVGTAMGFYFGRVAR